VREALALLGLALALAACGGEGAEGRLTVFAAASLREALPRLDAEPRYVFGGSSQLAVQLADGAAADVFVSASPRVTEDLARKGVVEEPVVVASNRLVVVVPRTGSAVSTLADLARPGVKLVLGATGVPAGDYAREALPAAGLGAALENVVSLEDDVRGVVAKVALGEADAGVAYATDVRLAAEDVRAIPLPDVAQPAIAYTAAVVARSGRLEAARAYLERLAGPEGRAALRAEGFLPPRG
jgi:molybdate transport system substrate-binding protein